MISNCMPGGGTQRHPKETCRNCCRGCLLVRRAFWCQINRAKSRNTCLQKVQFLKTTALYGMHIAQCTPKRKKS